MKINLEPVYIQAKTLPEAWFKCVKYLIDSQKPNSQNTAVHSYKIDAGSFAGQHRLEFDYVTIHIEYPGSRPMIPDVPQGIPCPSSDAYVQDYLQKLMTSHKDKNEEYTYGEYVEPQMSKIIAKYIDGPGNNQCIMTIGDRESINQIDPPCLRFIDTRIINGILHFVVYFRSWDLWAGFPNNLAALQILKEYMASELNVADGNLIASSKGLHLYDYSLELARGVVDR
jgi:thymidylate synthase